MSIPTSNFPDDIAQRIHAAPPDAQSQRLPLASPEQIFVGDEGKTSINPDVIGRDIAMIGGGPDMGVGQHLQDPNTATLVPPDDSLLRGDGLFLAAGMPFGPSKLFSTIPLASPEEAKEAGKASAEQSTSTSESQGMSSTSLTYTEWVQVSASLWLAEVLDEMPSEKSQPLMGAVALLHPGFHVPTEAIAAFYALTPLEQADYRGIADSIAQFSLALAWASMAKGLMEASGTQIEDKSAEGPNSEDLKAFLRQIKAEDLEEMQFSLWMASTFAYGEVGGIGSLFATPQILESLLEPLKNSDLMQTLNSLGDIGQAFFDASSPSSGSLSLGFFGADALPLDPEAFSSAAQGLILSQLFQFLPDLASVENSHIHLPSRIGGFQNFEPWSQDQIQNHMNQVIGELNHTLPSIAQHPEKVSQARELLQNWKEGMQQAYQLAASENFANEVWNKQMQSYAFRLLANWDSGFADPGVQQAFWDQKVREQQQLWGQLSNLYASLVGPNVETSGTYRQLQIPG